MSNSKTRYIVHVKIQVLLNLTFIIMIVVLEICSPIKITAPSNLCKIHNHIKSKDSKSSPHLPLSGVPNKSHDWILRLKCSFQMFIFLTRSCTRRLRDVLLRKNAFFWILSKLPFLPLPLIWTTCTN